MDAPPPRERAGPLRFRMKIHLAHCPGRSTGTVDLLRQLAEETRPSVHQLTEDPLDADLILLSEAHLFEAHLPGEVMLPDLRRHPVFRDQPEKCLVYDERDKTWCYWPGLYVSMPAARFDRRVQRAWAYIHTEEKRFQRSAAGQGAPGPEPDLLFSFVGSPSHPLREKVLTLRHPRAVVERVDNFMFWDTASPRFSERRQHFAEVVARSKFILCPRGRGTSSVRVFETLAAGRVPVIISDQWVPPDGPDWPSFSLTVAESQVGQLPELLERAEPGFDTMAARCLAEYQNWFSRESRFNRMVEQLVELQASPAVQRWRRRPQAAHREYWYAALRYELVRMIRSRGRPAP